MNATDAIGIALTKGFITWVDPEDADLSLVSWGVQISPSGKPVQARRGMGKGVISMHRVIAERMGLSLVNDIDHIDCDSLNNRRSNLRAATRSQNKCNEGAHRDSKSGVKGVSWRQNRGKWRARISVAGKTMHLGSFETIEAATDSYAIASAKYHGEFGRTK